MLFFDPFLYENMERQMTGHENSINSSMKSKNKFSKFSKRILYYKYFYLNAMIVFFLSGFPLHAQGHWEGTIHIKKILSMVAIFGENVNIRKEANTKSEVVMKLQPGDLVTIISQEKTLTTIDDDSEYWYKVEINKKQGYVWGGLLADTFTWKNSYLILFRSLGTKSGLSEIRILKDNKILRPMKWNTGPIGLDDFNTKPKVEFLPTKNYLNPPELFFKIEYFVYSEIEYGYTYNQFFTLSNKGKLNKEFGLVPSSCDPPACGEQFVLFPEDELKPDPNLKRKNNFKANKNEIVIIYHSFSSDEDKEHEWSQQIYKWDGSKFLEPK